MQLRHKNILWLGIALFFLGSQSIAQSAMTDQEARDKYKTCWNAFESGKYLDCFKCCEELKKEMGKSNPKVLSLLARSGMNALPLRAEGMEKIPADQLMKLNYTNLDKVRSYLLELSSYLNPAESNNINNRFIKEKLSIIEKSIQPFAKVKDKKPEDAIKFLNECAEKFQKQVLLQDNSKAEYTFELKNDTLVIFMKARDDWSGKAKFRTAYLGEMYIPLKQVWIEQRQVRDWPDTKSPYEPFEVPSDLHTTTTADLQAPLIVSTITVDGNKIFYDQILQRSVSDQNKNMNYPYDELKKRRVEPADSPVYIHLFFNSTSKEYEAGNYRKKIEEAFSFLIEYFGGGEPRSKTEKKNYF